MQYQRNLMQLFLSLLPLRRVSVQPTGQSGLRLSVSIAVVTLCMTHSELLPPAQTKATRIFALYASPLRQYERSPAVSDGMSTSEAHIARQEAGRS